jgi:hypothetical protein
MAVAKQAGAAQQSQTPSSTPKKTSSSDLSSTFSSARGATGIKEEEHKVHAKEAISEAVSRKHFQQVADLIKGHESQEKRNELATHHAGIFSKQNPRFDHGRFHKAAGSTAHEGPKSVKESVLSVIRAKMEEQVGQLSYDTSAKAKPSAKAPIIPKSALAPGQSLRDYMNAKQGLTRRDGSSAKPAPSSGPSGAPGLKGPNSSGFGTTNPSVRWKDPVTAGKTADKPAATPAPEPKAKEWQAPMSVAPKAPDQADTIRQSGGSVPSSMTKAAPSMSLDGGKPAAGASAPVSTPTVNPSKPSNVPDSVAASKPPVSTPAPSAPSIPSMAADPKALKLKESVQVGTNKYRIV